MKMRKVQFLMFWILLAATMLRAQEKPNIVLLWLNLILRCWKNSLAS